MTTSRILFLVGVLCGVFFAAVCLYAQRREGRPFGRRWWSVPMWIMVGSVAFGAGAYLLDSGTAEQTLFEAEVPGPASGGSAELSWDVPVEHAGARHTLGVFPDPGGSNPPGPTAVHVVLVDDRGRVLVDETRALEVRCKDVWDCDWDSYYADYVPGSAGPLRLTVTMLTADVPALHVWVGDDEKTDGRRIAGY